jgi:hypothetical protein
VWRRSFSRRARRAAQEKVLTYQRVTDKFTGLSVGQAIRLGNRETEDLSTRSAGLGDRHLNKDTK